MNEQELHGKLSGAGVAGLGELDTTGPDPFVVVEGSGIRPVLSFLRDDPTCRMEMLHLVTGIEREDRIEVAYHVSSLEHHHSLTLKVVFPRPEAGGHDDWRPGVPSVADIYPAADWHEREQWDLLGIEFEGHPDMRRILLPDEWIGHPLRKDYSYPSEHGGIPLELDAVPMYERGPDWEREEKVRKAKKEERKAGTPLRQPPAPGSDRPHAGGQAPASSKGQRHVIEPHSGDDDDGKSGAH